MYSKILVAVDGSPFSSKALEHAISLAKTYRAKLTIIYVVHMRVYIAAEEAGFVTTAPLIHDMEEAGKSILDESAKVTFAQGIESDTMLVHGIPEEQIMKKAEAEKYDLIVIGSRGRTAAKAFLLGSVSDRVSHHARLPVLVVK